MALLIQSEAYKQLEMIQEVRKCLERALEEAKSEKFKSSVRKQIKELLGSDAVKTEKEVPIQEVASTQEDT